MFKRPRDGDEAEEESEKGRGANETANERGPSSLPSLPHPLPPTPPLSSGIPAPGARGVITQKGIPCVAMVRSLATRGSFPKGTPRRVRASVTAVGKRSVGQ